MVIAALAFLIRQVGRDKLAHCERSGVLAMGFVSQAAKTALVGVADGGDQSAVAEKVHMRPAGLPQRGRTYPAVQRGL
jgi:hypothetical protein